MPLKHCIIPSVKRKESALRKFEPVEERLKKCFQSFSKHVEATFDIMFNATSFGPGVKTNQSMFSS